MISDPEIPKPAPAESELAEEPEVTQEESIPSDGADEEGEQLIEKLGEERRARARDPMQNR